MFHEHVVGTLTMTYGFWRVWPRSAGYSHDHLLRERLRLRVVGTLMMTYGGFGEVLS